MESKCPCCCEIEKLELHPVPSMSNRTSKVYSCCNPTCWFRCNEEDLPRIAAAMDAERRLTELLEAVEWERECGTVSFTDLWFDEWNRTEEQSKLAMQELRFTRRAARAAVDELIK